MLEIWSKYNTNGPVNLVSDGSYVGDVSVLLSTEASPVKTTATVKPHKYGPCTTFEISGERLNQLLTDVADPNLFMYMTLVALCRRARMEQFNALTFDPSTRGVHHDEEDIEDEAAWIINMLDDAKRTMRGGGELEAKQRREKLKKLRSVAEGTTEKAAAVRQEALRDVAAYVRRMKAVLYNNPTERRRLEAANHPGLAISGIDPSSVHVPAVGPVAKNLAEGTPVGRPKRRLSARLSVNLLPKRRMSITSLLKRNHPPGGSGSPEGR